MPAHAVAVQNHQGHDILKRSFGIDDSFLESPLEWVSRTESAPADTLYCGQRAGTPFSHLYKHHVL